MRKKILSKDKDYDLHTIKDHKVYTHQNWKSKLKDKFFPHKTLLINMELRNGFHKTFVIATGKRHFRFMGGAYVIDGSLKYYNISAKMWCLDYHQDFSIPFRREFPLDEVKKAIESSGISEVENSTNPVTLERFITAKIAEGVMKAGGIDAFFKQIKFMIIIILVACIGHLLLFMFKAGIFQNISGKIPGIG